MSGKLKFKIISCSSQQDDYPVSSLLFHGSQGWQTRRFCTFPQQITLQFYGIVNIKKIQLVSDHRKVSSQVDILYYAPTGNQQQRFYKYGYLQFNRNDSGNLRQQKTIMVDINCLYLRFLFHRPHSAKNNFFSQIGLYSLVIYGSDNVDRIETMEPSRAQYQNVEDYNEEDENYITNLIQNATVVKQKAVAMQDYDTANRYKQIIELIYDTGNSIKQHRSQIRLALQKQDYDYAKKMKQQIQKNKKQIEQMVLRLEQQPQQLQDNQFANANLGKSQQTANNQFMQHPPKTPAKTIIHSRIQEASRIKQKKQIQSYDQKIIPTKRPDRIKTQNQQFQPEKAQIPQPTQIQGKYVKDAQILQQYFSQQTVMKFFSIYWQHVYESLTTIQAQCSKKQAQIGLIKALTTIVKYSSKQTNFQVSLQSLNLFQSLLKINSQSQAVGKPGDLQNDLQQISRQIIKRLSDNNPKVKAAAQQAFALMTNSSLYGVEACSLSLTKAKGKLAAKQSSIRLGLLAKIIQQHGIGGGNNTCPMNALDFAIDHLDDPSDQVRRLGLNVLKIAYNKDPTKVQPRISVLKQGVLKLIKQGDENIQKPKKSK